MMKNHIVFFSGGKSSFAVAHQVKTKYPNDNILLYFTDTLFEDEDLYRFIFECSDKLKLPLLTHSVGKTPLDLMIKNNFIFNSRLARCSYDLKVKPAKDFIIKGIHTNPKWHNQAYLKDENITANPILYFGIDFTEQHRTVAIAKNWQPYEVRFPLIDEYVDSEKLLKEYGIKRPQLYDLGFAHNNCKGRCVKGGQAHWINLLEKDYKSFCQMRDFEKMMNQKINKGTYSFLKKKGESYTLEQLESDYNNKPKQIDMFDFGGCGCFVEEDL